MSSTNPNRRWRILIADTAFATSVAEVASRFENVDLVCADENHSLQSLATGQFDGLITQQAAVDEDLVSVITGLKAVLKVGRSYHNVDVDAIRKRGILMACAPRKGPNCVAELAITLILALSKDLLISHHSVAEGAFRLCGLSPEPTSQTKMAFHWMQNRRVHEIRHKTLGIIGMGEIGCELALRATVMGMRVIYYKRSPLSAELEQRFQAEYRNLPNLLQESDYVCLAVPHTPETERMIGREQLNLMKKTAHLVNVGRGGLIDEQALVEVLAGHLIAGAGLDVFTLEPLQADSPLCNLDNVILTPHIGGGTGTNRILELGEALDEMVRILSGTRPQVPVHL